MVAHLGTVWIGGLREADLPGLPFEELGLEVDLCLLAALGGATTFVLLVKYGGTDDGSKWPHAQAETQFRLKRCFEAVCKMASQLQGLFDAKGLGKPQIGAH